MATTPTQCQACTHHHHICSIVPPHLLQEIINNQDAPEEARAACRKTFDHAFGLRTHRTNLMAARTARGPGAGAHQIIPPHTLQAVINSDAASPEDRERAQRTLENSDAVRAARAAAPAKVKHPNRIIYDCQKGNRLPGIEVRDEGEAAIQDVSVNEVYDYFGNTFDFYWKILQRYSIDNKGLKLIGSVHFDDIPGPPGYDNAFWDGEQMIFGDGDGTYFESFTSCLDIVGHELTHGVTGATANLDYNGQSGALNESVSDVFGTLVKQYAANETSDQADWLIGEGIFTSRVNGTALRSMKAPGTAYNDPVVGKDPQPADMAHYVNTSDDNGGVHINSGIPNRAFYEAAVGLGGHSWEKAGKIWYATLTDPKIKNTDGQLGATVCDFKTFADFTVSHAQALFGEDAQEKVQQAWTTVGVYSADKGKGNGEL